MKRLIIILITLWALAAYTQPQFFENEGAIVGMIIDKNGSPLNFVNLFLFKAGENKVVDAVVSDDNGKFMFQKVKFGNYDLEIKFIGFKNKKITNIQVSENNRFVKIGKITIEEETHELGEVVVQGQTTTLQYKLDKKVISVGQDIAATGGDATDLLRNVPSVNVDFEGNVTLRGSSNFIVMIDGKPSILEPNEALKQIPASNIEKIEIITNPSAKYDPDGDAGIINIITKQKSDDGLSGKIELGLDTYLGKNFDLLLNYKRRKLTLTGQFIFNERYRKGSGQMYRENYFNNYTQYLDNETNNNHVHGNITGKIGMQYLINNNNILTINFTWAERQFRDENESRQHLFTNPFFYEFYLINNSLSRVLGQNLSFDINYDLKFKDNSDHKLTSYLQLNTWNPLRYNGQKIDSTDANWQIVSQNPYEERTIENIKNRQGRYQLDYVRPLNKNSKLEVGIALRGQDVTSDYKMEINKNSQWIEQLQYSNQMNLQILISSVYLTYSNKLGKLFDYQIGFRGEYTYRDAIQKSLDTHYIYNKLKIYPTLHLSRNLPFDQQLQFSYTVRVNRPDIRSLNPFPMKMNQFTYRSGNPALEPEYTHSLELNYLKKFNKNSFSVEAFYKQTNNKIENRQTLLDTIILMRPENIKRNYSYGAEAMTNLVFLRFINLNLSANIYNYNLEQEQNGQLINKSQILWSTRMNLILMLPTKSFIQFGGFYNAPTITVDGQMKEMYTLFAGVRQSFLNNKLQISINFQDVFWTMRFGGESRTNTSYNKFEMKGKWPQIGFSITYRLRSFKQERKMKSENGAQDEFDFMGEGMY